MQVPAKSSRADANEGFFLSSWERTVPVRTLVIISVLSGCMALLSLLAFGLDSPFRSMSLLTWIAFILSAYSIMCSIYQWQELRSS